jgi:hypothetical protein
LLAIYLNLSISCLFFCPIVVVNTNNIKSGCGLQFT